MKPELQELVQVLLAGTHQGAFKWSSTPEKGVYRLMLDKGLVRIYELAPRESRDNSAGFTLLNADGVVLEDVQVRRADGGPLVRLYELVDGGYQEKALRDILEEVRGKLHGLAETGGKKGQR